MRTKLIDKVTFYSKKGKNDPFMPQQHVLDSMPENNHRVLIKYDNFSFGSVADHERFATLILNTKEKDRLFYEVLLSDTPQFLFCDIDGEFEHLPNSNVTYYLDLIIEILSNKVPDFEPDFLRILDSSTDDKLSLHLSYPVVFKNYEIQKRFWNDVLYDDVDDKLTTIFKRRDNTYERRSIVDISVYSKNRPMRTIFSHKKDSPRTLKPYIYYGGELVGISEPNVADYLICQPDAEPEEFWDYQPQHEVEVQHLLTAAEVERIITNKVPNTKLSQVKGGLFTLANVGTRTCLISGDSHTSNNSYVVWKRDGLYFYCHSVSCQGKSFKIHDLSMSKKQPPNTLAIAEDKCFKAASFMAICYKDSIESEDKYGNKTFSYVSSQKELDAKKEYLEKYTAYIASLRKIAIKVSENTWTFFSIKDAEMHFLNCTVTLGPSPTPFFDIWKKLIDRKQVSQVGWFPHTINSPEIPEDTLNIFTKFLHPVDANFKIDMNLINPWLHHIEYVWADKDARVYNYLLNWFAYIVQKCQKTGVNIVIKSIREGAGKNILTDFICNHVLGSEFTRQFSDLDSLLGKFNASAEKSMLTVLDEVGSHGAAFKNHNRLKDLTTRVLMPVERKGMDSYMAVDRNSNIFSSNDDWIMKLGTSDRRNLCIEASSIYIDNTDYWAKLMSVNNKDAGLNFFHYLLERDISCFNPRVIPMTDWKRSLLDKSTDPYFKTIIALSNFEPVDGFIMVHSTKLLELYNSYGANKYNPGFNNIRAFNNSWMKYTGWQKGRYRLDDVQKTGFKTTPEALLSLARKIRKDPQYEFPKISEDEPDLDKPLV